MKYTIVLCLIFLVISGCEKASGYYEQAKSSLKETTKKESVNTKKEKIELTPKSVKDNIYFNKNFNGKEPAKVFSIVENKCKNNRYTMADCIDGTIAAALMKEFVKAESFVDKGLLLCKNNKQKAVFYAQHAIIFSLTAQAEEEKNKKNTHYKNALQKAKKAAQFFPDNEYFTSLYQTYSILAGDKLEKRTAEVGMKQLVADAAGKEVMDPVTGSVIIVGMLTSSFVTIYLASDNDTRKILAGHMPEIYAAIGNAGIRTATMAIH